MAAFDKRKKVNSVDMNSLKKIDDDLDFIQRFIFT